MKITLTEKFTKETINQIISPKIIQNQLTNTTVTTCKSFLMEANPQEELSGESQRKTNPIPSHKPKPMSYAMVLQRNNQTPTYNTPIVTQQKTSDTTSTMSSLLKKGIAETAATIKAIYKQRKYLNKTQELLDTSNKLVVHLFQRMNEISTIMETATSMIHSLVQRVKNIAQIINTNNNPTTFLPLQHTKILDNLNIHQPQTTMQIIENTFSEVLEIYT